MNTKNFSDGMNELDNKYVDEAVNYKKKAKHPIWMKWGALAACLCLIISGIWVAHQPDEKETPSQAMAQTVILNDEYYYICGKGEASILQECGLPTVISSDLAGNHIAYLKFDGNHSYTISDKQTDVELFSYAPEQNSNIYIVQLGQEYYAAIRHDQNGYHGLK